MIKSYTPLDSKTIGFFDLLIKKYPDGSLTPKLFELNIGDQISVKGPIPKLNYVKNKFKSIGMIAGGTGLAPMVCKHFKILNLKLVTNH